MGSSIKAGGRAPARGLHGLLLTACLGTLLAGPAMALDMFKCTDENGSQSFSDKPCGKDAKVVTVKSLPGGYQLPEGLTDTSPGYHPLNDPSPPAVVTQTVYRTAAIREHLVEHPRPPSEPARFNATRPSSTSSTPARPGSTLLQH